MDEVCLKVVVHNETQPAVSTPSPVILYDRSFDTRNHYILILKKRSIFRFFAFFKQNFPEITHPSFPNGTVLQCEFGKEGCHISLYTKPAQGSNKWQVSNFKNIY